MERLLIAITGPVGAGKTSFIRAISEIDPVDTDRRATDDTSVLKPSTTVALDFGRITLNSEQVVYLYGTPGQVRFDFMWEILMSKVNAAVLLIDAHRPQDFRSGRRLLNFIKQRSPMPIILGVTHTDCEGAWELDDVALALGLNNASSLSIVSVNADNPSSVAQCLTTLIEQM